MYVGDPRITPPLFGGVVGRLTRKAMELRAARRPVTFGRQVALPRPQVGRAQHAQIQRLVGRLRAGR